MSKLSSRPNREAIKKQRKEAKKAEKHLLKIQRAKGFKSVQPSISNGKNKRMKKEPKFWKDYEKRLETFKLGVLLKQARMEAGLTQEQIARQLRTTKSVISRMENHATDIRLSTLEKFAKAVGKHIHVALL